MNTQQVKIITDSACDIPLEEAATLGVTIVPLIIRFGEEEFLDLYELSHEEFAKKLVASKDLPATAAPSPGSFAEAFTQAFTDGFTDIICINISSGLSGTLQSAQQGAGLVEDPARAAHIRFIDTLQATVGEAATVRAAAVAAKNGDGVDEVERIARSVCSRTTTCGALNTLEYLRRGGRIGKAGAFFGALLSIKPIIQFENGEVRPLSRQRTRSQSIAFLCDYAQKQGDAGQVVEQVLVGFMRVSETEQSVVLEKLRSAFPNASFVTSEIGSVVGTHGGPGTIAISFVHSEKSNSYE